MDKINEMIVNLNKEKKRHQRFIKDFWDSDPGTEVFDHLKRKLEELTRIFTQLEILEEVKEFLQDEERSD